MLAQDVVGTHFAKLINELGAWFLQSGWAIAAKELV